MLSRYMVLSAEGINVSEIDALVAGSIITNSIPDRSVEVLPENVLSKRCSVYKLTTEEADELKKSNLVKSVELHIEDNPNVLSVHTGVSSDNYDRKSFDANNLSYANYGLIRHTSRESSLYDLDGSINSQFSDQYKYSNSGEGVDIFIMDTGVQANHPDFLDEYGKSRVQQIDWTKYIEQNYPNYFTSERREALKPENYYQDNEGFHGTQCASIAAGNRYGWAKKAHIYSLKINLAGYNYHLPSHYQMLAAMKSFIEERQTNGINRPAILSNSWGIIRLFSSMSNVTGGFYADENTTGTQWSRGNLTNSQIQATYKILPTTYLTANYESINQDVQDLIDIGVHVVASAANHGARMLPRNDAEYNNIINWTDDEGESQSAPYNQVSTPHADEAIIVGGLSENLHNNNGNTQEQIVNYSVRGKRVDVMAASDGCFAAVSELATNKPNQRQHPDNSSQFIGEFGGTSCSCPQTAGVMALHLSNKPHLKPDALRELIINESTKDVILGTGGFADVNPFLDTPNRMLYSKFNQDISLTTAGTYKIINANISGEYKFKTKFRSDNVIFRTNGVTQDNDGFFVLTDTDALYEGSTIRYIEIWQSALRTQLNLVFDAHPVKMKTHNWNTLEIQNHILNVFVKLHRTDAVFDPIKQSFYWDTDKYTSFNTSPILSNSGRPDNSIGIR